MTCQIALAGRSADGPSRTRSMPWPTGSPPPPGWSPPAAGMMVLHPWTPGGPAW